MHEKEPTSPTTDTLLERRLGRLTALAGLATGGILLLAAAKLGEVLNVFAFDAAAVGSMVVVALACGFVAGWISRGIQKK